MEQYHCYHLILIWRSNMVNKYRLASTSFERKEEDEKVERKKIYFLSVEGNLTEKQYFEGVSANRNELGIKGIVDVEVLKRASSDNNSAPKYVVELLEECVRLRELGVESFTEDIPKEFIEKYGMTFVKVFLKNPDKLTRKQRNCFITELQKIGYDIKYRKHIHTIQKGEDEFCVLIDKDRHTHSLNNLKEVMDYCREKGYQCYIANPCFEFWLLLHLSDVKTEYKEKMDEIKENRKISNNHTYVSREVSEKAHHGKGGINFKDNYLPYVRDAMERAKEFASDEESLIEQVGCNLWKLLEMMMQYNIDV